MIFSSCFRGQHDYQYEHGQFTSMEQNKGTPRKINIEPENAGLEDDFLFQGARILRFQSWIFRVVWKDETTGLGDRPSWWRFVRPNFHWTMSPWMTGRSWSNALLGIVLCLGWGSFLVFFFLWKQKIDFVFEEMEETTFSKIEDVLQKRRWFFFSMWRDFWRYQLRLVICFSRCF